MSNRTHRGKLKTCSATEQKNNGKIGTGSLICAIIRNDHLYKSMIVWVDGVVVKAFVVVGVQVYSCVSGGGLELQL